MWIMNQQKKQQKDRQKNEIIPIVTPQDEVIATANKYEAHRYPVQRHRAVSVWMWTPQGNVLLQQRSSEKIVGAGWWANTVCGNVWQNESYEACAVRRLEAELGYTATPDALEMQRKFEYRAYCNQTYGEHEIDQVFVLPVALETVVNAQLHFAESEVAQVQWVSWDELKTTVDHAVAEQGYYTSQASLEASWNELAENMRPLAVTVAGIPLILAPWTTMMIAENLISIPQGESVPKV